MLLVVTPPNRLPERRWALATVLSEVVGVPFRHETEERTDVSLVLDGAELVVADVFFAKADADWLTERTLPPTSLARWRVAEALPEASVLERELPVLFGEEPYLERRPDGLRLGLDVFGSVFLLLS